jgi:Transketolase, C-terminal domain
MAEINLLRRYPRAKRNIEKRTGAQSETNIRIARRYGREYFDGSRDTGYGGYRYDGRWLPIAEDMIEHFGLRPGDRVLDASWLTFRRSATWPNSAPNTMQIVAPCDPAEVAEATRWCARQRNGPVYLRIGKSGEPILTKDAEPWAFGKLRCLRRGSDVCILSYGVISKMAAALADRFAEEGKSVSLFSCHTLKPLDREGIAAALRQHDHVIAIEEHVPQGGLAPQTKQIAWDIQARCRLDTFTLQDRFIHNNGRHHDLLADHGLSLPAIWQRVGPG